jgi:hypothetical protein
MNLRKTVREPEGTGSGTCPVASLRVSVLSLPDSNTE